ncbi:unnamed protein product [Pleuronectes platessa]|uniref:Uncharacterized protein n=1 Tax=Pleuronectes platessa TaxID=8262 RepID=A0A9N7YEH1_PLEPL|nr:unnamed protein product [Pleuronectes platessa]
MYSLDRCDRNRAASLFLVTGMLLQSNSHYSAERYGAEAKQRRDGVQEKGPRKTSTTSRPPRNLVPVWGSVEFEGGSVFVCVFTRKTRGSQSSAAPLWPDNAHH